MGFSPHCSSWKTGYTQSHFSEAIRLQGLQHQLPAQQPSLPGPLRGAIADLPPPGPTRPKPGAWLQGSEPSMDEGLYLTKDDKSPPSGMFKNHCALPQGSLLRAAPWEAPLKASSHHCPRRRGLRGPQAQGSSPRPPESVLGPHTRRGCKQQKRTLSILEANRSEPRCGPCSPADV